MATMYPEILREIRINPIIPSESVLIATERGNRPDRKSDPPILDRRAYVPNCPFCVGNENQTPEAIIQLPHDSSWQIRVVRNLFPVFGDDSELTDINFGVHHIISGYGRHEVIIDHVNHGIFASEMEVSHIASLFSLYRDRMKVLYSENEKHTYILIFKNYGPASGGSIDHTHSQIIAMPVIPANVEMEIISSHEYYQKNKECIFCTLIDEKKNYEVKTYDRLGEEQLRHIAVKQYIIESNSSFIAIKPFASRYPWEVHVLPKKHNHDYQSISDAECLDLAEILQRTMLRLQNILGAVQYNYFLHSAPNSHTLAQCEESFHWHLEICPRTSIPNGFELGSGLAINTLSPEKAAEKMRSSLI